VLSVTYRLLTLFLLTLLLIITIVFIQSKLARKENEAVGLILPTITFIIAALLLLSLSSLNNTTTSFAVYICQVAMLLIVFNIPTIALTITFFVCRKDKKAKKELTKMNIMDLE
jgi:tellurite resistance protein TehA-like permease